MTESCEPECWEDVEQLTLNPAAPPTSREKGDDDATTTKEATPTERPGDAIDQALKEALKNPRERANVLRIDADVFKFISDKTRCTIEFSYDLTSYQRLLAHRVSQMYGLQTSSVPLGNGLSRVIAHKTQDTKPPPVRVVEVMDVYYPPENARKSAPPEVTIKRRESASSGGTEDRSSTAPTSQAGQNRTVKQREEEYRAARDRILGESLYIEEERPTQEETDEDGKSSKAVFRDRAKELQDPDYRRGAAKCYQRSGYGPDAKRPTGVYNAPTYQSEFPALPGATVPMPQGFPGHDQAAYAGGPIPINFGSHVPRLPYPPPYGFPPQPRPFRMEPPAGSTQWKYPPTTGPPAVARPPQLYGGVSFSGYPSYGGAYQPFAVRSPYIAVAQGVQPTSAPEAAHLHLRRKPLNPAQTEDTAPSER